MVSYFSTSAVFLSRNNKLKWGLVCPESANIADHQRTDHARVVHMDITNILMTKNTVSSVGHQPTVPVPTIVRMGIINTEVAPTNASIVDRPLRVHARTIVHTANTRSEKVSK